MLDGGRPEATDGTPADADPLPTGWSTPGTAPLVADGRNAFGSAPDAGERRAPRAKACAGPALVGADALVDDEALAADDAIAGDPAGDLKTPVPFLTGVPDPPLESTTTATTAARPTAAPGAYSHRRRGRRPPAAAGAAKRRVTRSSSSATNAALGGGR